MSYLHFATPAVEASCESFVHVNAPGHVVELGVFVGNFSIQAVGEVVQDANAVLHRLKSPPEQKMQVSHLVETRSSTVYSYREDIYHAIVILFRSYTAYLVGKEQPQRVPSPLRLA